MASGRRLVSKPMLLQDWEREGEETESAFFELFLDLVLVAGIASVADGLAEEPGWRSVGEAVLFYILTVSGWNTYTHLTTRFRDESLLHHGILFVFLLGFSGSIVHIDALNEVPAFAVASVIQRLALLAMMVSPALHIPRARAQLAILAFQEALVSCCLASSAALRWRYPTSSQSGPWASWGGDGPTLMLWGVAALVTQLYEPIMAHVLAGEALVPINIEHSTDRYNCLVLVALGENVVSATLAYRDLAVDDRVGAYYTVSGLSFLMSFSFLLLFFALQPSREDHAFRRSRRAGLSILYLHRGLGGALIGVSVGTKVVVAHVVEPTQALLPLPPFTLWLFGVSTSAVLACFLGIRMAHFAGRHPRASDPPNVRTIMWTWWAIIALAPLLPLIATTVFSALTTPPSPVLVISIHASILAALCIVESVITHILHPHLLLVFGQPVSVSESEPLLVQ